MNCIIDVHCGYSRIAIRSDEILAVTINRTKQDGCFVMTTKGPIALPAEVADRLLLAWTGHEDKPLITYRNDHHCLVCGAEEGEWVEATTLAACGDRFAWLCDEHAEEYQSLKDAGEPPKFA